jgi:tetratricopeptide (TPR) repeat protein
MGWRCIFLMGIMICTTLLWGQNNFLQSLDASTMPDSAIIDRINDHAYTLVKAMPDSATFYAQEAIARSQRSGGYAKGLINAHILLGILDKDLGYYGLSVENYLKALKLAEGAGDSLRVSGCLNNLGSVYYEQGNYLKSLSYFQRSLAIENKLGKDKGQASIRLVNIGDAYWKLDSLDKAAAFYYNSLLIEEELKNEDGMFYARLGIGRVDTRKGNYSNAKAELDRAIDYATRLQNHPGICEVQIALGELYLAQQQFGPAKRSLDAALVKGRAFHFQGLEVQALGSLYQVLKAQGDLAAANGILEEYYTLRETVNSATVNSRIGELQTRYELGKKDQEIALFKEKEILQASKMGYERKLRNYLLFSVVVTIALIVYNNYRARRDNDGI